MQTIKRKLKFLDVIIPVLFIVVIGLQYQVKESQVEFKTIQKERISISDSLFKSLVHNDSIRSRKIDSLSRSLENMKKAK